MEIYRFKYSGDTYKIALEIEVMSHDQALRTLRELVRFPYLWTIEAIK